MTTALITGIAGQDGVYLARHLHDRGYRVIGTVRPGPAAQQVLDAYLPEVAITQLDIRDTQSLGRLLSRERPDEIYNLASWSSVGRSWAEPELVTETNGLAVLRLMELLKKLRDSLGYQPKFCQASSSEMFGLVDQLPATETAPHNPRSPYAVSKSFAHHTVVNYRESYGIFAANAILFNHESPLRPDTFVTRKITKGAAAISLGMQESLTLGRLDIRRDWGSARDVIRAMHLMLQQDEPGDFNIATGESPSLDDFLREAFTAAGVPDYRDRIRTDPALHRPADVPETRGDATRAHELLGWTPTVPFSEMVTAMVRADMTRARTGVEHDIAYL